MSPMITVFAIFISFHCVGYFCKESSHVLSSTCLIVPLLWTCVFLYLQRKKYLLLTINSYVLFLIMLLADNLNFVKLTINIQISYLLLSLLMLFFCVFVDQVFGGKKPRLAFVVYFSLTMILHLVPLFYIIYAVTFNTFVTRDVFYAISQTNLNESFQS